MTTINTHILLANNMAEYWKDIRAEECELGMPESCKFIDQQIAKYKAQAEHLSNVQGEL